MAISNKSLASNKPIASAQGAQPATVNEQVKLAFASVTDLTKQLITLATAVLALEVTFTKGFIANEISKAWIAPLSWIFLLTSVIAGIWALMALAGTQALNGELTGKSLYAHNIRIPCALQIVLFSVGMGFSIYFGYCMSIPNLSLKVETSNVIPVAPASLPTKVTPAPAYIQQMPHKAVDSVVPGSQHH